MGLDACVYCNCFERGLLREPPRPEWEVYIDNDGCRCTTSSDLDTQIEFDVWSVSRACEHDGGALIHHRLGNIGLVGLLRDSLRTRATELPIMWTRVIKNGVHCGDHLVLSDVERLTDEIKVLSEIHDPDAIHEGFLRRFEIQLRELTGASLAIGKPIVF